MMAGNIRLLFYLPELNSYHDRAHMVSMISRCVAKAVLLTTVKNLDPRAAGFSETLDIVEVPKANRSFPGRTYLAASRLAERLIKKHQINVVHDTFGHLLPLFLTGKRRFPGTVFLTSLFNLSEWDMRYYIWPRYGLQCFLNRNLRLWLMRLPLQRAICGAADHIVVQAPGLIDRIVRSLKLSRRKISWIPNNVKMTDGRKIDLSGKSGGPIRLLYVGGFCRAKGGGKLLELLHIAKSRGIDIQANIVGGMVDLDAFYLKMKMEGLTHERVIMTGRISHHEVETMMRQSDWLFHVTKVDGSPRVVLESLALGTPVIGSHHPGIEVLDPDHRFVIFTQAGELEHLLDELVRLKNDRIAYQRIAQQGYDDIMRHNSSVAVARRYVVLYQTLLNSV